MRRQQCHRAQPKAADSRLQHGGKAALLEEVIDERDASHDGDAEPRAKQREDEQRGHAVAPQREVRGKMTDEAFAGADRPRDQHPRNRCGDDRRETEGRICADDEFERVEGAGQRSAEGRADGARRSRADEHPPVCPTQIEDAAETRGETRTQLRVAGLKPDRCPEPIRAQGLCPDDQAVDARHATTVQRVGLNRIDGPSPANVRDQPARDAEEEAATGGNKGKPGTGQMVERAERAGSPEVEQKIVQYRGGA